MSVKIICVFKSDFVNKKGPSSALNFDLFLVFGPLCKPVWPPCCSEKHGPTLT